MKTLFTALIAAAIAVSPLAVPTKASADPVTAALLIGGGLVVGSALVHRDRVYVVDEPECRVVHQRIGPRTWRQVEVCD